MENRMVKFNIKQFIEDYIFCIESSDEDGEKELLRKFNKFFIGSEPKIQRGVKSYMVKSKIANDYEKIRDFWRVS
jgi:hypothetical protein